MTATRNPHPALSIEKGEAREWEKQTILLRGQPGNRQIPKQPFYSRKWSNALNKRAANKELICGVKIVFTMIAILSSAPSSFAYDERLESIVTPDFATGRESLLESANSRQADANPYECKPELGLTKWAEVAVFRDSNQTIGSLQRRSDC